MILSMKTSIVWILTFFLSSCASSDGIKSINIKDQSTSNLSTEIYLAEKTPAPTVLVLHGCGGVDNHHRDWAKQLQAWGFNAVVLDSFKSRYVASACQATMSVSPLQRAVDANLTAKWILEQPWSSPQVGIIGFSHGAWASLHAATVEDMNRELGSSYITSAVALYPYCGSSFHFYRRNIPLQIHIGTDDNWTPSSICKDLAKRWQMHDQYFEYQGAHHGFDRANTDEIVRGFGDTGFLSAKILRSDPKSNEIARNHIRTFFKNTLRRQ